VTGTDGDMVVGLRHDSDLVLRPGMVLHLLSWLMATGRGDRALKSVSPDMSSRCRLDQLPGDPQPPASTPDTALRHVAHAQLAPDLLDVDRATLVGERRIPRDHE
jgi:hypothetical protein